MCVWANKMKKVLSSDNNAAVVATMTVSEICQAVADDKSKLAEELFVVVCNLEHQTSKGIMSMSNSLRNY